MNKKKRVVKKPVPFNGNKSVYSSLEIKLLNRIIKKEDILLDLIKEHYIFKFS
jgi:hypothetical protein